MKRITPDMLRDVAKAAGLTGAQASELIGCNPRTWRRWVGGESECPVAVYEWLRVVTGQHPNFHATKVSPEDYYEGTGVPPEALVWKLARAVRDAVGGGVSSSMGEGYKGVSDEPFERTLSVTLEGIEDPQPGKVEVARQVVDIDGERCLVKYWARQPRPDQDDEREEV